MKNKAAVFLVLLLICFSFVFAFNGDVVLAEDTSAKSCVVVEGNSKRVLFQKNANQKLPMASTTKIMTAITAIESCKDLDEKFEVSKKAVGVPGTSLYLREGDIYSVRDLLYALMLISGNDASVAIAERVGGSTSEFITMMNDLAKKIGVKNTHFANTHGLDADGHYTTAYDLAIIASYALENPIFQEIVSTKNTKVVNKKDDTNRYLKNKNKLLFTLENCVGVKTGYTDDAGRCLVSAVDKDGMKLVCVVLNCGPMFEESAALLKECLNKYKMCNITELYEYDRTVAVEKGAQSYAKIGTKNEFFYPLNEKEIKNLKFVYDYQKTVYAPLKSGSEIGQIQTFLGNNLLFSEKIYTIEDIKPKSVLQRMKDFFGEW